MLKCLKLSSYTAIDLCDQIIFLSSIVIVQYGGHNFKIVLGLYLGLKRHWSNIVSLSTIVIVGRSKIIFLKALDSNKIAS